MTLNQLIQSALAPLELTVYPDVGRGGEKSYIVWNYADERGTFWADGEELNDRTTVQVHYFTTYDPIPVKKKMRCLLHGAGFSILSTVQTYEDVKKLYHVIVEAEIVGVNNDGEE